ncbi:hypothetical protein HK100_008018 [Physocladia obscura]|uniref:TIR domain-containing protein n=1 Tax=Physocladia obscura TaxID=109957 RepID=A0AAD5T6U4_9FUNG|nr:hypothetical protein HK100_008018 [Physocladia obscura]
MTLLAQLEAEREFARMALWRHAKTALDAETEDFETRMLALMDLKRGLEMHVRDGLPVVDLRRANSKMICASSATTKTTLLLTARANNEALIIDACIADLSALRTLPLLQEISAESILPVAAEALIPTNTIVELHKLILISHCWNDKHIVEPIALLLEQNEFSVLFDKGVNVDSELYQSIFDDADLVVAFLSDD